MKIPFALALSLVLVSVTSLAHAGNEGPHGVPQAPQAPLIAEAVFYPGFFAPPGSDGARVRTVQLRADGMVYKVLGEVRSWVATLSPEAVARIARAITDLAPQVLHDESDGGPMCTDAPSNHFRVFKSGSAEAIEVAKTEGCHHFQMETDESYAIENALSALQNLAD